MTYRYFSGVVWLLAIVASAGIGHAAGVKSLGISVNRTGLLEGQCVVVTAVAKSEKGQDIPVQTAPSV